MSWLKVQLGIISVATRGVKLWLEHYTNPLHVYCRFMDAMKIYERLWRKVFVKDESHNDEQRDR